LSSETQKFKLLKREKDTSFNIDSLERYDLLLMLGPYDLQIAVLDTNDQRILLLEDYILPGIKDVAERLTVYRQIFDDHHLLLANFWNEVKISFKNRKFSLVPEKLFDEDNPSVFLNLNTTYNELNESLHTISIDNLGLKIVFAVETMILDHIKSTYPKAEYKIVPHCASFIRGYEQFLKDSAGKYNCIYIDRFGLHQTIFKDGELQYYNLFPVNKFEDYERYIYMVSDNLGLNAEKDNFLLWGYLGAQSDHFLELKKKFPRIELGQRPRNLKLGYTFDEIPEHQYFDLFSLSYFN
jgi:hypothetical protein